MALLELDENHAQFQIRSYTPGRIQINERVFTRSVILSPQQLIEDWTPQVIAELTAATLHPILTLKPDVLLIGTGSTMVILAPDLYGELINQGIGVEFMATSAACRTFNALSAEHRNVVAALILQ